MPKNKKKATTQAMRDRATDQTKAAAKKTAAAQPAAAVAEENNNNRSGSMEKSVTRPIEQKEEEQQSATSRQTNSSSDEVIEEFDFSDSDLKALSDNDNNDGDDDEELVARRANAVAVAVAVADNASNQKQTQACNDSDTTVNETVHVTEAQTMVSPDKSRQQEAEELTTIEAVGPAAAVGRGSKTVPPTLNLDAVAQDQSAATYCPITPRCIVDHCGQDGEADDDDYGDEDDDEPENELLVQFLGEASRIAEARLAARRQARAEAREIRMRELERQQKEQEQNADRVFDMQNASGSVDPLSVHPTRLAYGGLMNVTTRATTSRRSSEDSLEEEGRSLRDIKHELKDVEERFRKAMITNAQLDNDRASQTYEVKLLKDKSETMQESYAQLQREFKEKSRECNALKRNLDRTSLELKLVQGQLSERDVLIAEQGLVIVAIENADGSDAKRALVSVENANVLASVQGSLDVRLKKFSEEKQQLLTEVQKLNEQLEAYKSEGKTGRGSSANGPFGYDDDYEAQREANKIISDYKYKLQKAEQEVASLQASLARSETQVIRYKSTAEAADKAEAELKVERRKLQREHRETLERLEEAETANNHLLKRLDKLKNAKSAILKDL